MAPPDLALTLDKKPVREWCQPGVMPEPLPTGWWSCTVITRADGERLRSNEKKITEATNPAD